jgi:hypothetical protein
MGYEQIDDILVQWSADRRIPLLKSYMDEQVRSFEIVDSDGKRFQIWVDLPDDTSVTMVHVWDFKKRTDQFTADWHSLYQELEKAFMLVGEWGRSSLNS